MFLFFIQLIFYHEGGQQPGEPGKVREFIVGQGK